MERQFSGLITAICILAATCASAADWRTGEATLERDYAERVMPYYEAGFRGVLWGKDNVRLVYRKWELPEEKGAVVFVTGWTETAQKYAEFIYNLGAAGYSVYVMDHRGQGLSQRLAPNPLVTHVEHYGDYVADLKQFVDRVVKAKAHERVFFVGHSMGSLIAAIYAAHYPWDMRALVTLSPNFQVETGKVPESVAYSLARAAAMTGFAKSYIATHGDSRPSDWADFRTNTSTNSPERWKKKVQLWTELAPSFQSGVSNRWLQRTIEATRWMRHGGGAEKIRLPVLMMQSGRDTLVDNAGGELVCRKMQRCRRIVFANARHELLLETDPIRNAAIGAMLELFERNR